MIMSQNPCQKKIIRIKWSWHDFYSEIKIKHQTYQPKVNCIMKPFLFILILITVSTQFHTLRATDFTDSTYLYPDCTEPENIRLVNFSPESILFTWDGQNPHPNLTRYLVRYRIKTKFDLEYSSWIYQYIYHEKSFEISKPTEGAYYEFQLKKICDGNLEKYSKSSDWVDCFKVKTNDSHGNDGENQSNCPPVSASVDDLGSGRYKFQLINATLATNCGERYHIRYKVCPVTNPWRDAYIFDGDQVEVQLNAGESMCKAEIRLVWEGCGTAFGNYCNFNPISSTLFPISSNSNCDGDGSIPSITGHGDLSSLNVGNIIKSAGIPIEVDFVRSSGGAGFFSGTGVAQLPFQDIKVKVNFEGVHINDSWEITDGIVKGLTVNNAYLPYQNVRQGQSQNFMCRPKEVPDGWENGIHTGTGLPWDENGFDQDGKYILSPPYSGWSPNDPPIDSIYDPNGFDSNGIHKLTGTKYNEDGCGRNGIDSLGNPCDPNKPPYYFNDPDGVGSLEGEEFYKKIKESLIANIESILQALKSEAEDRKDANSASFAASKALLVQKLNSLNSTQRQMVAGSNDEFINEGMSQEFRSPPNDFLDNLPRDANIEFIEKEHKKLYDIDIKFESIQKEINAISYLLTKVDSLEKKIANYVKLFDKEEVQLYEDQTKFDIWLEDQLKLCVEERVNDFSFIEFDERNQYDDPNNPLFIQWASNENETEPENYNRLLEFQYKQGNEFINGTHRAFYMRELCNYRATHSATILANEQYELPLSWSAEVLGRNHVIYIDKLEIDPITGGKVDLYYILDFSTNRDQLVFSIKDFSFGPNGFDGAGRMQLQSDFSVKLFNTALLKIKGTNQDTYVEFDCTGFKSISVDAEIEFCREYLTPVTANMEIDPDPNKKVKARFKTQMESWTDFYTLVTMDNFALTNFPDVKWKVSNVILDFSDTRSDSVKFPANYQHAELLKPNGFAAWKGFYIGQLSAYLPPSLDKNGTAKEFGVRDVIIDDMGFTGEAYYNGVLISLADGNLDGWAYSLNNLYIKIISNDLSGAGFEGSVNLPLFTSTNSQGNGGLTDDDCFTYKACWKGGQNFEFALSPAHMMKAPLWVAEVQIDPNSKISIAYNQNKWTTSALLNGRISIDAESIIGMKFQVPGIGFQNLSISNTSPYISGGIFGSNASVGVQFDGFELTVRTPRLVRTDNEGEAAFKLAVYAHLGESGSTKWKIDGEVDLSLIGKINTGYPHKWNYERFAISKLGINATISDNTVAGSLQFFNKNEGGAYGSGWRGQIKARFGSIGNFAIDVIGQFGKIKNDTADYKYFMVDAVALFPGGGIPMGALRLRGIAGGLYRHMKRVDAADTDFERPVFLPDIGQSISGVSYVPNSGYSIGFKVGVILSAPKEEVFNGNANVEMVFNSGGGLANFYFTGNAQFLTPLNKQGSLAYTPGASPPNNAPFAANLEINLDFNNHIYTGTLECYARNAGGVINGIGTGGLMGLAELQITPGSWYIWIGTPKSPCGVTIGYKSLSIKTTAYLCMGTKLPDLAPLPSKVTELTGGFRSKMSTSGASGGVMFGTSIGFETGPLTAGIFYAAFEAGAGFDLNVLKFKNVICAQTDEAIGINGWYAQGRIWGYFAGDIGLIRKKTGKRYKILSIAAAAAMEGGFPNPFYARGAVGGSFKILGGLVRGKCHFNFTLGEKCQVIYTGSEAEELEVIANINPDSDARDVFPGTNVVVDMNIPVGIKAEITDENGNTEFIEVKLKKEDISLKNGRGQDIPFDLQKAENGNSILVKPLSFLEANDSFDFSIKVDIYSNDQFDESESKSVRFFTGGVLEFIPEENVEFSYPIKNMQNFHYQTNINGEGMIQLYKTQYNVTNADRESLSASFISTGEAIKVNAKCFGNRIYFPIPTLTTGKNYLLVLSRNIPSKSIAGNEETGEPGLTTAPSSEKILEIPFRTSLYPKVEDKFAAMEANASMSNFNWIEFNTPEGFTDIELSGGTNFSRLLNIDMNASKTPAIRNLWESNYQYLTKNLKVKESMDIGRQYYNFGYAPYLNLLSRMDDQGKKFSFNLKNVISMDQLSLSTYFTDYIKLIKDGKSNGNNKPIDVIKYYFGDKIAFLWPEFEFTIGSDQTLYLDLNYKIPFAGVNVYRTIKINN